MSKLLDLVPSWLWAAVVVMLTLACGGLYVELAKTNMDLANSRTANAALNTAIADAALEAAEQRIRFENQLTKAKDEARQREATLRDAADAARTESQRLRDTTNSLRDQLANASREAVLDRAVAIGAVLSQCAARYQVLAERCDRHVNDLRTLTEAWPR